MIAPKLDCVAIMTLCLVAIVSAGCRKSYLDVPIADLEQRKAFRAIVERVYVEDFGQTASGLVVIVGLKTEAGERISIGGQRADSDLVGFARTLEKGKYYEFPKVWLDYKTEHKQGVK